ncbi:MAG: two-component sensor histidine kinase [Myxococcales bacterium]|nr:two-component sensor histidine kinase [Myxococcales bacterium]
MAEEQTHRRFEALYEISKLFASFEDVAQMFVPVLEIATRTLPLRSAVLMESEFGGAKMKIWPSDGTDAQRMRDVTEHVEAAYAALLRAASPESPARGAAARPSSNEDPSEKRFTILPLVVADRPPLGALQLEGDQPLDTTDLVFASAIANQLALALDRDRSWRRDVTRREHAEARRTHAEARGAAAELQRVDAEKTSDKHAALAAENARLYEQARLAVSVREQILAIVSHDLRNPLGTILLTTAALAKKGTLPVEVARIERAAERMRRLIDDLLDFASIEAGHLAIKRQPQDSQAMLHEMLASFEDVARDNGLEVTGTVESPLPKAFCDRDRILQVLSNLIGNATKATPRGGHISLRIEASGNEILFAVADDGPGISEEDLRHLFDRYWRSDEVQYKGTGLGLAIARGIVTAHGGRIWAESELGRGATFQFTVPVADETLLFDLPAPPAAREG